MRDVDSRPGMPGQLDVPRDDDFLGNRRPAGQAEPPGDLALVAARGAVGQPGVLRVLGNDPVKGLDVVQRPAHEAGVVDAAAVVGEDPHPGPGAGHEAQLGQFGALERLRHRPDRVDVHEPGGAAEVEHPLGHLRGVADRVGVGHREHRGEAPDSGGCGPRGDGLRVLVARLAQVGVQVHQTGQQDQAVGVDDLCPAGRADRADLLDLSVGDEHVGPSFAEEAGPRDQDLGRHTPSSVVSAASRW